jgi:hypothetical protein
MDSDISDEFKALNERHRKLPTTSSKSSGDKQSVTRVEFSHVEDEDLPSYSPRPPDTVDPDEVKDKSDKREQRDRLQYLSKHPGAC